MRSSLSIYVMTSDYGAVAAREKRRLDFSDVVVLDSSTSGGA